MCLRMSKQASFNIIEQDGASNNKVDDIRDLIGHVNSPPPHGNYKVFIIDEVHMLTSQAFNAFLKTLEEPPPHAIFILATTEKHKILPTILSRCQIYDFRRVEVDDIAGHLRYISEQEGIEAEGEALHLIAQKADGALRDSLSLFDRISSASDGPVTYQAVIDNLNILDFEYYFETTDALLEKDIPAVLKSFEEVLRKGFEPQQILNGLSEHFRDLLLCQQPDSLSLLEVGAKIKERYQAQAQLVDMPFLLTALEICNQCDMHYVRALNKRLHVELALAKLAHIQDAREVDPFATGKKKVRDEGVTEEAPPSKKAKPEPTRVYREEKKADREGPEEQSQINESPPATDVKASFSSPEQDRTKDSTPAEKGGPPIAAPKSPSIRRKKGRPKTPNLSSLADLEATVESQQTSKEGGEAEFTIPAVQDFFEKLSRKTNPGALKLVLNHIKVNIQSGELFLFVESSVEKTTLLQEVDLIQDLRDRFGRGKLKVHIEIDPDRKAAHKVPERPKTKKEVLDEFTDQNETFKEMMDRWKLTFDK
jgi:DNA polymerase-3 subunit gamma/tau